VDAAIGNLLEFLDKRGLADNTLLLFTSDNGPEDFRITRGVGPGSGSSGRFRGRKRSIYEGGVRMPCIARWPGRIPAGTVDSTTVMSSLDWLPTVSALVGEELPPHLDGEDMLENITVIGDARDCRAKLDRFRSSGADMPVVAFPHGASTAAIQRTLEALAPGT